MKLSTLLPLAGLALCACNPDIDDDGITNKDEKELGTNPESQDSDGDGLFDAEEVSLGTNPVVADSDADGLADAIEVDNDSDPLDPYSWPGDGIWPSYPDAPEGDGYAVGEVFPSFDAFDRNDAEVNLNQFHGLVMLVDFSAGWCGPCRQVAGEAEDLFESHKSEGFTIVHAMTDDNNSNDPEADFLEEWTDQYDIEFPVVGRGGIEDAYNDMYAEGINEGYIPFMILLDRDMKLDTVYTGTGNEAAIEARITELTAE